MWDSLEWVWGSECGAGGFVVGVCVWDSLEWVWWSECGAGGFVVGGCGTVWRGFGGVSVEQVALWWVGVCVCVLVCVWVVCRHHLS